jgi:hypothetical protein
MINDYIKFYTGTPPAKKKEVSYKKLKEFLKQLCQDVNNVFFPHGGVRTHFRYLHMTNEEYITLVVDRQHPTYAMNPKPSVGKCMIPKAAYYQTPLIYSIYPEWHSGTNPSEPTRELKFEDYVTFVLMDNALKHDGNYLLSMGISFENADTHRDLYYIMTLSRFDTIISNTVKTFTEALNINLAEAINVIIKNSENKK